MSETDVNKAAGKIVATAAVALLLIFMLAIAYYTWKAADNKENASTRVQGTIVQLRDTVIPKGKTEMAVTIVSLSSGDAVTVPTEITTKLNKGDAVDWSCYQPYGHMPYKLCEQYK